MIQCKGKNVTPNQPTSGMRCAAKFINDRYNGYCYRHKNQYIDLSCDRSVSVVPKVTFVPSAAPIYEESINALGNDTLTQKEQDKVLTELSEWMPNEKERVLSATQLVLDKCKQQQDELTLLKEQLKKQQVELILLKEQQADATKQINTTELTLLKEQQADATKYINTMLPDYTAYQEIRKFEEISTRLMSIYMADSHYELYGMMRSNPKEAIQYLGESPEIQYDCLRRKRNKLCHPVAKNYYSP